jgi:hypothetical protein
MKKIPYILNCSALSQCLIHFPSLATWKQKGLLSTSFSLFASKEIQRNRSKVNPFSFPRQTPLLKKFYGLSVSLLHGLESMGLSRLVKDGGAKFTNFKTLHYGGF